MADVWNVGLGCQFLEDGQLHVRACLKTEPFHGSYPHRVSTEPMGVEWLTRDIWNETKRGWQFAAAGDPLRLEAPESQTLVLKREQPNADAGLTLGLIHHGVDFAGSGVEGVKLEYFLQLGADDVTPLPTVAWADWDREGRLLMATREGTLEVCACRGTIPERIWKEDLRRRTPDPQAAQRWASRW